MLNTERKIVEAIAKRKHLLFALLDSENLKATPSLFRLIEDCDVDGVLVGGSTIGDQIELDKLVKQVKSSTERPVILFPGNITGISRHADAIFFSSLLNSDDPYFLIGAQAVAAFTVWKYHLEAIPMGYLIAGEGVAAGFVGRARPFPSNRPKLIASYALAAKFLGMRFLYLEAGSGASKSIPVETIKLVRSFYDGVLIVGGGIREPKTAKELAKAGADILVVGNLLETNNPIHKLKSISKAIHTI
jgi:phosphoglycerol geranylgeranyltransferase